MARTIRQFQTVILPEDRWDPARGASLSTFFIGQCLIQYSNAARRWRSSRGDGNNHPEPMEPPDLEKLMPPMQASDREDQSPTRMIAFALLADRPARNRRAVKVSMFAYSQREIAAELGITEPAVTMMLSREREALRRAARQQIESGR